MGESSLMLWGSKVGFKVVQGLIFSEVARSRLLLTGTGSKNALEMFKVEVAVEMLSTVVMVVLSRLMVGIPVLTRQAMLENV